MANWFQRDSSVKTFTELNNEKPTVNNIFEKIFSKNFAESTSQNDLKKFDTQNSSRYAKNPKNQYGNPFFHY